MKLQKISSHRAWAVPSPIIMGPFAPGATTVNVQPPSEKVCSIELLTTALSARAPKTPPKHCANMYTKALDMEIIPTRPAEKEIIGFMWPPEIGWTANRRIEIMIAANAESMRFGILTSDSIVEITIVSSMNTRTAVPRSSELQFRTLQT
ncbi:2-succinyl-5-enolpyruvyl-6-hydroxy-3-cyclohexene-1-carboxylate synthase [Striga asiatica]|uniref:2-succinyl-5-enolpyruvyl-6-hydroxy-3-cyclohexene-1-carboxylate synthase n=1 Tax=Striga asiatica TaxID=4170 RepID=A0A5A7PST3_STRAF|nr:2-succinyl-5-enolpyruvyl-6-hydroxy-3-cyclohexene-1-carboxylate synthase [Striga asiatica]